MASEVYHKFSGGATRSEAPEPIPVGPPHVIRYALNCGPGLNIPTWAVYIALAHFADDRGVAERTHRQLADAIDGGSVSTVKVATPAPRVLRQGRGHPASRRHRRQEPPQHLPNNRRGIQLGTDPQGTPGSRARSSQPTEGATRR